MHGWGGDLNSLKCIADVLSHNYRVTLVDFFGFGNSPHGDIPLILNDYVNGVKNLINYYKMNNITLIGHSFGGRVGILLTQKFCYYVNKLVLISGAGLRPRKKFKFYFKKYLHKLLLKLKIRHDFGSFDYKKLDGAMKKTFTNIINQDLTKNAALITAPTLLMYGKDDKDTPLYMGKKLNSLIVNSRLIVLNGGHFAYLDDKNTTILQIKKFLGE